MIELLASFDRDADRLPFEIRLQAAALVETARRTLRESKGRVATLLANA